MICSPIFGTRFPFSSSPHPPQLISGVGPPVWFEHPAALSSLAVDIVGRRHPLRCRRPPHHHRPHAQAHPDHVSPPPVAASTGGAMREALLLAALDVLGRGEEASHRPLANSYTRIT